NYATFREIMFTAAERNRYIFVANYTAGFNRGYGIRINLNPLIQPQRHVGAIILERKSNYLANLHARNLDLVASLQARDIVEVRIDDVALAVEQFDFSEPQRQDRQCRDARHREKSHDKLGCPTGVHLSVSERGRVALV